MGGWSNGLVVVAVGRRGAKAGGDRWWCAAWKHCRWHAAADGAAHGYGCGRGLDAVGFGLCGEHALGLVAMSLAFAVLFVRILYRYFLVHEVLAVHICNGVVRSFEVGIGDEAVAFGESGLVAGYLWLRNQGAEAAEGVVENALVHHRVEIANEKLCADFDRLGLVREWVCRRDGPGS